MLRKTSLIINRDKIILQLFKFNVPPLSNKPTVINLSDNLEEESCLVIIDCFFDQFLINS